MLFSPRRDLLSASKEAVLGGSASALANFKFFQFVQLDLGWIGAQLNSTTSWGQPGRSFRHQGKTRTRLSVRVIFHPSHDFIPSGASSEEAVICRFWKNPFNTQRSLFAPYSWDKHWGALVHGWLRTHALAIRLPLS